MKTAGSRASREDGSSSLEPSLLLPSLHVQLQQVADATLTLFVDEIFTVVEVAVLVLSLFNAPALGNRNLLAIQGDENVLRRI